MNKTIEIPRQGGLVDMPIETRAAPVNSVDGDRRTIDVIWTVGAAVERFDWRTDTRYIEVLEVSDTAIRMGRLNAGGPVLNSHNKYDLDGQIAVVDRAWIADGKGYATVRFPKAEDDPDADRIFRKVSDGIIRSLSCAYYRHKIEIDRSKNPQVWRVVDWEPIEISFVAVPADPRAQALRDDAQVLRSCEFVVPAAGSSAAATRSRMTMRQRLSELAR